MDERSCTGSYVLEKNLNMIAIATHAALYNEGALHGPADAISEFLTAHNVSHLILYHPLAGRYSSWLVQRQNGQEIRKSIGPAWTGAKRYPLDVLLTIKALWSSAPGVVICVDPLNGIAGLVLKLFRRTRTVVYFSVDYAQQRFSNTLLNWIYHFCDRLCVRYADYCWGVSRRIVAVRLRQGVTNERNIHIPNAPAFNRIPRPGTPHNPYELILVSDLQAGIAFRELFEALRELIPKYPQLSLTIIGGGEGEKEVRAEIVALQLEEKVHILGKLPHRTVHEILGRAGIGIALYTDEAPWRYYSDPMKVRDYLACGLPVILSGDLDLGEELVQAGAGIVVEPNTSSIVGVIETLLANHDQYKTYHKNALTLADRYDLDKILTVAFRNIGVAVPTKL